MNTHSLIPENVEKIYSLPDFGFLKVNGTEAKKLLQGQLTCNLEEVTSRQGCMGAHCHPQGKVLSLFYIFQLQHAYYLLMPRLLIPIAMQALKKYALFYKVEIREANNDCSAIGYIGDAPLISTEENPPFAITQIATHRYILLGSQTTIEKMQMPTSINPTEWQQLNLRDGIPTLCPNTSGLFLPHDINLDKLGAIHFDKGCYTGQEIIARMHYRGKLKRHMYLASITASSPPIPGSDIYSRQSGEIKTSGIIVDVCPPQNQTHQYEVLLVTEESHAKPHHLFLDEHTFFTIEKQV